jgi:outer membrane protein OmpA-like peptidoglycan-associated protein
MRVIVFVAVSALLAGCATRMNQNLMDAEAEYRAAASDPTVASKGSVPLYEAKKDLDQAKKAFEDDKDKEIVDHWAYLAKRKSETARATAERAVAQDRVETLGAKRDAVVLGARTREADEERARAEAAETTSEALRRDLASLESRQTNRGLVITLPNDVLFDVDRSDVKPGASTELERVATVINEEPGRRVLVEGHADSTGPDSYNLELSRRRAESVARALVDDGVSPSRVISEGLGETQPIATNDTPEGRQQNRRVEVVVLQPGM